MARLAIRGGKAALQGDPLRGTWPIVTERDVQAVARVTAGGQWGRAARSSRVEKFERDFARFHDTRYCLAVANGTVAVETALRALGVEPGQEVIVPAVTFIASASAVLLARAVPVFAYIDPETYQVSAESIEAAVTRRTRGIVVVHYAGYPADMDAIRRVARRHKLFVVEDCAHAHGSQWRGRGVGALGDAGAFSFQQSKALSAGEGGAVVTNRRRVHECAIAYHSIGRAVSAQGTYHHTIVGPNYRMTEFQGALLASQLRRLRSQTNLRMRNSRALIRAIADIPGLVPLKADSRITRRGYYFFVLRYLQDRMKDIPRSAFLKAARAEGLPLGTGYGRPVYAFPAFAEHSFGARGCPVNCKHYGGKINYAAVSLPASERAAYQEQLTISHPIFLYKENIPKIAAALHRVYAHLDELREGSGT